MTSRCTTVASQGPTLSERFAAAAPRAVCWLAVGYGLLAPLMVLPISATEFAGAADLLAPLCLAVVLIGGRLSRLQTCHVLMLLWWTAALVSLLPIRDPLLAQSCVLRWIRLVAVGAPLFLSLASEDEDRTARIVLRCFCWGGLLAIVAGLVVYWLQIPIHPDQQQLFFSGGSKPMFRAGGLAGNTGIFGHLVATWAVLSLGISRNLTSPWRRQLAALAILALGGYAIWVSSSRSALLNVLVSLTYGWCLLSDMRERWQALARLLNIAIPAAVLLGLPAALWLARDSEAMQTSLARFTPGRGSGVDDYASGRLKNWSLYLGEVESHPVLGAGYKTGYRKFHERAPDNSVISILYETGLLGLTAGIGLVLAILIPLSLRGYRGDSLARLLAAAWMGQLAHGLTADIYTFWLAMPVLYLLTGLALARPQPSAITPHEAPAA